MIQHSNYAHLEALNQAIIHCNKCPRLRHHCEKISLEKRKSYRSQDYWGKPVTGFGDPLARLFIVGLAPGAHGANRTGRVFTGDRSGDWLYRALFQSGFANQPSSIALDDGLRLKDAYISCVVKCAPPDNKPLQEEQKICCAFLKEEIHLISQTQIWIALGQIAFHGLWPLLPRPKHLMSRPAFKHGAEIPLDHQKWLLLSYHPSQQNTFTGKLTETMFDSIFNRARELLS